MNKLFDSRQEASDYYDKFNPHMRSLNTFNTCISDFDPETRLGYIVKEYTNKVLTIPPFEHASKA